MSISKSILPEFDHEMANTRKTLERVPDDKFDWKTHEKSMTLARLAAHVADFPNWALTTVQVDTLEINPADIPALPTSKGQILEKFEKDLSKAREAERASCGRLL